MWLWHPEDSRKCDAQLPPKGPHTLASNSDTSQRGGTHGEQLSRGPRG